MLFTDSVELAARTKAAQPERTAVRALMPPAAVEKLLLSRITQYLINGRKVGNEKHPWKFRDENLEALEEKN